MYNVPAAILMLFSCSSTSGPGFFSSSSKQLIARDGVATPALYMYVTNASKILSGIVFFVLLTFSLFALSNGVSTINFVRSRTIRVSFIVPAPGSHGGTNRTERRK